MTRVGLSKRELEELYIKQKRPMSKLAESYRCSKNTIAYWMDFYGIKRRTTSEAVKLFARKKRIKIPKKDLIELYGKKKIPPSEIAKKYNCKLVTVLNRLREYRIKIRPSKGANLRITKEELRTLYEKQELTTFEIAERHNCSQATIWKRLKKFGIKARKPHSLNSKVPTKQELKKLYVDRGLSTWKIAEQFGFSRSTVHRKLKEYGIKPRSRAASHFIHKRRDFSGDLIEKAYLIGFRIGDLRVRKPYKNSETIAVECGTTKEEQLELIEKLFKKYAPLWITKRNRRGAKSIGVNLPLSFNFLLEKTAGVWVFESRKYFFSFLAGFTDAEGYIGTPSERAIYVLGNYDKELLQKIRETLISFRVECRKLSVSAKKGYISHEGYIHNEDYWVLQINRKIHLLKLFNSLKPYIKHKAKVSALNEAIENIQERNKKFGNINMNIRS